MDKDYLRGLNKEQYQAATTIDGPMLVLAGAGSGKTKTLVHRVVYMIDNGIPPESILLLTFTNKAANEMKTRAKNMLESRGLDANIEASTFHSFCAKMLRIYGEKAGIDPNFTIITPEDEADAVNIVRVELGYSKATGLPKPKQIVSFISTSVNKQTDFKNAVPKKFLPFIDILTEIKDRLAEYKTEKNYVSYDDILLIFLNILRTNKDIRQRIEGKYRYIMVDEYQDTNILQDEILDWLRKNNKNIAVVGDDMQSIYAFRGAEVQNIIRFPERHHGCKTIVLDTNYRSTQKILNLSNHIMEYATEGYPKHLSGKSDGTIMPTVIETCGQRAEAETIIKIINKLKEDKNVPLNEICILARQTMSFYIVEMELVKNGIPYEKHGGVKFMDKAHIKDVVAFLRLLANPKDELSWFRVLQLLDGVGPVYAREIAKQCADLGYMGLLEDAASHKTRKYTKNTLDLNKKLTQFCTLEFIDAIPEIVKYYIDTRTQTVENMTASSETNRAEMFDEISAAEEDLKIFKEIASSYNTLNSFLDDLILDNNMTAYQEGSGIILSTIHSVKGLEYNTVIIMDCINGIFPSAEDSGTKEDNEELRCFYVAVTRAKERLILMYPEIVMRFGQVFEEDISRYLDGGEDFYEQIYC